MTIAATLALMAGALAMTVPAAVAQERILEPGEIWEVTETTPLFLLWIPEGAGIRAPRGRMVTLTVDGVGAPLSPGYYEGDVVLTVTREIRMGDGEGATEASDPFRAAIYVEDGHYVTDQSVPAMVTTGEVSDSTATGIKILSREGNFNGIIVESREPSTYRLSSPMIILSGDGGNEATGRGNAILAAGESELFIENARIYSTGANRSALHVGGDSTVHVTDSKIEVRSGAGEETGDADAGSRIAGISRRLGITGTVQAATVVDRGAVHFTSTHIKSRGRGVLFTDASREVALTATDCLIETMDSGFGAWAAGGSRHTYSGCTFNVADYGMILGDGATGTLTGSTVVNSDRIGILMLGGAGGRLVIEKGSIFNAGEAVLQVRGAGGDIRVDGAILNTESGVILQAMADDASPGAVEDRNAGEGLHAVFRNTILEGDIVDSYPGRRPVTVLFENATITGAITTALPEQIPGVDAGAPRELSVSLDDTSAWIVAGTSRLTRLEIARNRSVSAPYGYRVAMTVDGVPTHLNAGTYDGEIVLTVTKL